MASRRTFDTDSMSTGEIEMIDINELRPAVEAAGLNAISMQEVLELLGRLEAAESDALEQARLSGMGSEREAALMAKLEAAEKERESWKGLAQQFGNELDTVRAELETERMRLAACGVVALANTPDSAKQAREMRPEYWSASCGDVARMVDENIKLRAMIQVALVVLDEVCGNINPERGYADELETDVKRAIATIHGAKGE